MIIPRTLLILVTCLLLACSATIPVNTDTTILTVPTYYEPPYSPDWNQINKDIVETKASTVILEWEGHGGWNWMGDKTISAIETAKRQGKTVIFELTGDAISMHAAVLCHASRIIWNGHYAIFHSGFNRDSTDGHKIYTSDRSYFDYCMKQGLLTEEDIDQIIVERNKVTMNPNHKDYSEDWK